MRLVRTHCEAMHAGGAPAAGVRTLPLGHGGAAAPWAWQRSADAQCMRAAALLGKAATNVGMQARAAPEPPSPDDFHKLDDGKTIA